MNKEEIIKREWELKAHIAYILHGIVDDIHKGHFSDKFTTSSYHEKIQALLEMPRLEDFKDTKPQK